MHRTVIEISNPSNKSMKEWKSLLSGKGIKKYGKAVISGRKIVAETMIHKPDSIQGYIVSDKMGAAQPEIPSHIPVYRLKGELFRELDIFGTREPLLVVEVPHYEKNIEKLKDEKVVLLIPFQDPANVGAVIRSSAAFGIRSVVLLEEAATPFHPKSIRASGAQVFTMDFIEGPSIRQLKNFGWPIVALDRDGVNLTNFHFPERFALLPGMEGPGLPEEIQPDYRVSIPMEPMVESLNAVVAVSIALYEWKRKCF